MTTDATTTAPTAPADTTTTTTDTIHSRAMLVTLSISTFNARRFDRKVSEKVNEEYKAESDAGRYTKHLFGGRKHSPSHSATEAAATAAREVHYQQTLPWNDEGWRLLPTENYFAYQEEMRKARDRFEAAVRKFCDDYPTLRDTARVLLNGLYRDQDYPEPHTLPSRFSMSIDYAPVPSAGDFRLDLPADQLARVEDSVSSRVTAATQSAMQDAWRRLYDLVQTYVERVQPDAPKQSRTKLLRVGLGVVDVLGRLNVANDPALEAARERVRTELLSHDPVLLGSDEETRRVALAQAEAIVATMSEYYTPADR